MLAAGAAALAILVAGCTAGGLESLEVTAPSINAATLSKAGPDAEAINPLTAEQQDQIAAENFVPQAKPAEASEVAAAADSGTTPLVNLSRPDAPATEAPASSGPGAAAVADANRSDPPAIVPTAAPRTSAQDAVADSATAKTSFAPPVAQKKGFLSSFFSQKGETAPVMSAPPAAKPKPVIQLAAVDPEEQATAEGSLGVERMDALPGVRQSSLFEIKRRDSLDDDSDVDLHEDEEAPVQYASAAGMARLAPNGLLKQRESVDVACLKPSLVRMLKQIERRFGKRVVVTSGYRSPEHNKRVRGARKSMHMYCAATDIQVEGVSKWDLANYVRSMPGRGGVGTYCHTNSVHVDVGPERDWNWKCRRRKT